MPGLKDVVLDDGLRDPMTGELMGEEADRLAHLHGVGRDELDEVAVLSQARAAAASEQGKFTTEIAPLTVERMQPAAFIRAKLHPRKRGGPAPGPPR